MKFSGRTNCKLDIAGRIKLPPKAIAEFKEACEGGEIIMYCLPEGALGLYPEPTWNLMRSRTIEEIPNFLSDEGVRQRSRKISSNSEGIRISPQGRLTIPPGFRTKLGFQDGEELVLVGDEHGYELWKQEMWMKEEELM